MQIETISAWTVRDSGGMNTTTQQTDMSNTGSSSWQRGAQRPAAAATTGPRAGGTRGADRHTTGKTERTRGRHRGARGKGRARGARGGAGRSSGQRPATRVQTVDADGFITVQKGAPRRAQAPEGQKQQGTAPAEAAAVGGKYAELGEKTRAPHDPRGPRPVEAPKVPVWGRTGRAATAPSAARVQVQKLSEVVSGEPMSDFARTGGGSEGRCGLTKKPKDWGDSDSDDDE